MDGKEMCKLSKEEFLDLTPGCVGDILYEHLQLLQHDADRNASPGLTVNDDFKKEPHQDPQHSPMTSSQGSVHNYEQLMDNSNYLNFPCKFTILEFDSNTLMSLKINNDFLF